MLDTNLFTTTRHIFASCVRSVTSVDARHEYVPGHSTHICVLCLVSHIKMKDTNMFIATRHIFASCVRSVTSTDERHEYVPGHSTHICVLCQVSHINRCRTRICSQTLDTYLRLVSGLSYQPIQTLNVILLNAIHLRLLSSLLH